MTQAVLPYDKEQIEQWLVRRFLQAPGMTRADIDVERPFTDYPFDSVAAAAISSELSVWLGYDLPITAFWDYPSIASLSTALAEHGGKEGEFL